VTIHRKFFISKVLLQIFLSSSSTSTLRFFISTKHRHPLFCPATLYTHPALPWQPSRIAENQSSLALFRNTSSLHSHQLVQNPEQQSVTK
jgi:hypothetical protein